MQWFSNTAGKPSQANLLLAEPLDPYLEYEVPQSHRRGGITRPSMAPRRLWPSSTDNILYRHPPCCAIRSYYLILAQTALLASSESALKLAQVMAASVHSTRELHFVTIDASNASPNVVAKQRKSLRAFVMRDYLRQKNDPSWHFAPAKVDGRIESHISRFRSKKPVSTSIPKRRNKKSNRVQRRPSFDRPRRLVPALSDSDGRVIEPGDAKHSPKTSRIHDLDSVDPFQTFNVDLSASETQDLLQYYHTSFWANSYACNPEGRWMSVALMDPAIIHATLSLVAIHRRDRYSIEMSKVYFKHRGEAMNIIASRLNDSKQATSDATIGAVAILSSSDHHFDWPARVQISHSVGLAELIGLHGGMDSLSSNRHIQRVAGWSDMLQAAMHGTSLRVKMPKGVAESNEGYVGVPSLVDDATHKSTVSLSDLPCSVATVLRRLRTLSGLKSYLVSDRNPALCRTFSNLIWKLEYSILDRDQDGIEDGTAALGEGRGLFRDRRMETAVGFAALIFSYSCLRNLLAPTLYDKLRARLKASLPPLDSLALDSGVFHHPHAELASSYPLELLGVDDELAILMWVLHLGVQGPYKQEKDKRWFTDQFAHLCWNHGILTYASAREKLQTVIPEADEFATISEQDWNRVEESIWANIILLQ